jgi:ABC-type polysaccharide/polyol phosphate export permease
MKYAQLIRLLVGRELTLRYKRSVIGIGWTLLNPMLTSFVLWVVFSFVFASRLPGTQQYAPYLMAGILLITFFNQGVTISAESIASNGLVLTKIYVPPQVFPISTALAGLVNFFIGMIPLTIVCLISGQSIAWTMPLVLVVGVCLALLTAGIGLTLSIMYIRYDDMSPKLQQVIQMNPLTSYLDIFRWAFSNNASATLSDWLFMFSTSILSIIIGTTVFKKFWPRTVAML